MVRSPDGGAALALLLMLSLGFLGHNALAQKSPKAFLQPHNAARAEVGVAKLSWNTTLAAYARRYAGRRAEDCKLVHSRGPYGENIFWGSAGRRWAAADAVASWVKEKANVRISQASSYFFLHKKKRANYDCGSNRCRRRKCGHYTQVVWANTKRVGCAAVDCHGGGGGTFIVCSYDPPGNVDGKPPYPRCGRYNRVAVV